MSEPTFRGLGASAPVAAVLAAQGIEIPFEIQGRVLPDALAGQDVLAKAPTGSGKTLAFGIPLVERVDPNGPTPAALVLVPTRELAAQVGEVLEPLAAARGLRVATAYGGVGLHDQAKKADRSHLLVATPGRLEDLANRKMLSLGAVSILVLDEADRMLDMGFQPQVDRIVRRLPQDRQTMFFSATLDGEVGRLARSYTTDPAHHEANPGDETVQEVDHRFVQVTPETKVQTLIDMLKEGDHHSLVFVRTRRGADRLLAKLRERGVPAVAMHGDMTQSARERAWERFESGKARTLVATDVAARGLDLDSISHVINFDPPEDNKGYVHRVGRTGRAGRSGIGVTLRDTRPAGRRQPHRGAARPSGRVHQLRHGGRPAAAGVHLAARSRTSRLVSERQLDWRTLLREPSLFDSLLGQNDYLDEFVRVHQTIAWPKHLDERPTLVQRYSWALPTDDALEVIARYAPVVEMGAGGGYWSHLMRERGIDVIAYDREHPHADNYFARHLWTKIEPGGPAVLREHGDRSLFLCWPPNNSAMATNCLKRWSGTHVIHVGEWRISTGSRGFHDRLEAGFELVEKLSIPQWEGMYDMLTVWRRR